jgi:orotate phosphoribosyltransferase
MNLFQLGEFSLHSGRTSNFKIECDALTDGDIECLASMLNLRVPVFSSVIGIPEGGLRLAHAMEQYTSKSGPPLIVDDVYTTGKSFMDFKRLHYPHTYVVGGVLFARTRVAFEHNWIHPLFILSEPFSFK